MSEELRKKKEERVPLMRSEECRVKSEEWLALMRSEECRVNSEEWLALTRSEECRVKSEEWLALTRSKECRVMSEEWLAHRLSLHTLRERQERLCVSCIPVPVIPAKAGIQQITIHGVDSALMSEERRKKKDERSLPRPAQARSL